MAEASPAAWVEHAIRLVEGVPTVPDGLAAGTLDHVLGVLSEADAALIAAARGLRDGDDDPLTEGLRTRLPGLREGLSGLTDLMVSARRALPDPPGPDGFPPPEQGYDLPPHERAALEATPWPIARVGDLLTSGWALVGDAFPARPGWGLLRHPGGATLWVKGTATTVEAAQVHERADALADLVAFGFALTDPDKARVQEHLAVGRDATQAIEALAAAPGLSVRPVATMPGGNDRRHRWFLVDTLSPVARKALVSVLEDVHGRLVGGAVLEGATAYGQLTELLARAQAAQGDARAAAVISVDRIRAALHPLLSAFLDPDADGEALAAALRPREGDAQRAFVGDVADRVAAQSVALWAQEAPVPTPKRHHDAVSIDVAPAGALAEEGPLSAGFSAGWRQAAWALRPGTVWVSWRYHRAGEASGVRYDGLVWLGDHWAWFPKAWRWVPARGETGDAD